MKTLTVIMVLVLCCGWAFAGAPQEPKPTLVGWGMDRAHLDKFFEDAEAVGFDVLITWSTDPVFLAKAVRLGNAHNIKVFSCIAPMGGGLAGAWKEKYPDTPFPWQVMSEPEKAAATFLSAGRNKYLVPYQCASVDTPRRLPACHTHLCVDWNHDDWTNFSVSLTNTVLLPETWRWLAPVRKGLVGRAVPASRAQVKAHGVCMF